MCVRICLLTAFSAVLAACSARHPEHYGLELDMDKARATISKLLGNIRQSDIACPEHVPIMVGKQITCSALVDGTKWTLDVTMIDDQSTVTLEIEGGRFASEIEETVADDLAAKTGSKETIDCGGRRLRAEGTTPFECSWTSAPDGPRPVQITLDPPHELRFVTR